MRLGLHIGSLAACFGKFRPVLLLDGHPRSPIFGHVCEAMLTNIHSDIPVDESVVIVAVPPIPVVAAVKIDAGREAHIVNVDPFVGRRLHIDGHDTRPCEHGTVYRNTRLLHRNSSCNDRRSDDNGTSEDERG
jgi:hypothetical protein